MRWFSGRRGVSALLLYLFFARGFTGPAAAAEETPSPAPPPAASATEEFRRFELVLEPDAYYSDIGLIISLTNAPIPCIEEVSEEEIYRTLLSRAAIFPQFLVLEASVNPLPYLGTYIKKHDRNFYDDADVTGSFNWVKAVTAGFEEPYAFSVLAGNVANFSIPGSQDSKGLGYSGYLFSTGFYHIRDNEIVRDTWREFEWKLKGDRKSPVKKLSWSFRVGAKLHSNPDITDVIYLSFRRGRVDYRPAGHSLLNNAGFEYIFDMDRHSFSAIRHHFLIDKKWPVGNRQLAFSLALGFVWESAKKYTGDLALSRGSDFQFLLRPNIEF